MTLENFFVFWVLCGSHLDYVKTLQPKSYTGDHLHTHTIDHLGAGKVFLDLSLPMQRNFPNSTISVSLPHK